MPKALEKAIYGLEEIRLPGIRVYGDRAEWEKGTGRPAGELAPPDLWRPMKKWVDLEPQRTSLRRVTYEHVLVLGAKSGVVWMSVQTEGNGVRRQFYADYGVKAVPHFEPLQMSGREAGALNMPWDGAAGGANEYVSWLDEGEYGVPTRGLWEGEAWLPTPFSPFAIVNMELYRASYPVDAGRAPSSDDVALRVVTALKPQLDRIEAALRRTP